ncbi:MAG TPA: ferritin-like domain-containing protein [Pirellulales bacterium]|nr:ferritin-like domain-containing protein [Pirellulales bacterium]
MIRKSNVDTMQLLNRLLVVEHRSLPMYLTDACPWRRAGDEKAAETLENIVADKRQMVARIVEFIQDRGGTIGLGHFPMEFTDTHDLSLDYLVRELVRCQRLDIERIERLVDLLRDDRAACELAQEALGADRAHLEALERVV